MTKDKNILKLIISKNKDLERIIGSDKNLELYKLCITGHKNKTNAFCLTNADQDTINEHIQFFEELGKENYFDLLKKNIEEQNFLFEWICYEKHIKTLGVINDDNVNNEL